jgi:hypothetical protein
MEEEAPVSGDYSRHSFDPRREFAGVLMQQGRVALDADWNELVAIVERRLRAGAVDTIGRAAVPRETPTGFAVAVAGTGAGKTMTIGRGRIYVHGLLAENHGPDPQAFDLATPRPDGAPAGVLAEAIGAATTPYDAQPHWPPRPDPLPAGDGPHLVYLDVWQREVTHLEDDSLLEKALGGVDTTTRLQTAWQVRVLPDVGASVTCATPDLDVPNWADLIRPSAGRLTASLPQPPQPTDPCLVPPGAGYRGIENHLYRVEIHDGGSVGAATFKWSRENGTVAARVTQVPALDAIVVDRIGRDDVLCFKVHDWVEVTDDHRELGGRPGAIRRIVSIGPETRRIDLHAALPADLALVGATPDALARRHARVRRWDQRGPVSRADGTEFVDLDDPASAGVIPVPPVGTKLQIEHGIVVEFSTEPGGGAFRPIDHWNFALRVGDAPGEILTRAPPRGIHHHYCRLAIVTFPAKVDDCRVFWPPEPAGGGHACGCSVCVTPETHNGGTLTIQNAVDQVRAIGGMICLDAGLYLLGSTPVRIDGAQSVRLAGQGWRTVLQYAGAGAALDVTGSAGIAVEGLSLIALPREDDGRGAGCVRLSNVVGARVERCVLLEPLAQRRGDSAAIRLEGYALGAVLRENVLVAPVGISGPRSRGDDDEPVEGDAFLLTAGLAVEDNVVVGLESGIELADLSFHAADNRIAGNTLLAGRRGGLVATGGVAPGGRLDVLGNLVAAEGPGLVVGVDNARLADNDISPAPSNQGEGQGEGDGIVVAEGLRPDAVHDLRILGNRVAGVAGHGVAVRQRLVRAMIKGNSIVGTGAGGIVMGADAAAEALVVENNQLADIGGGQGDERRPVTALRLVGVEGLTVAGNTISRVGLRAAVSPSRVGIDILACRGVRVSGNDIAELGPLATLSGSTSAAIRIVGAEDAVQLLGNRIRRTLAEPDPGIDAGDWLAILLVDAADFSLEMAAAEAPVIVVTGGRRLVIGPRGVTSKPGIEAPRPTLDANHARSWGGRAPLVRIETAGTCVASGNQCFLDLETRAEAVVSIEAEALAVANNVIRRPNDTDAIRIAGRAFTVVGNLTMGNIRVNGASLPSPWDVLNIVA